MDPVQILKTESPVISGALTSTIGLCIIIAVVAWWVTKQFNRGEVAALNERLKLRDEQIADVREKLDTQKIELMTTTTRLAEHPMDKYLREAAIGKSGMFIDHSCWRCHDGARPCVNGEPRRCEFPHARND